MPDPTMCTQGLALALLLADRGNLSAGSKRSEAVKGTPVPRLRPDSTVGDILRPPSFAGFASLILPWDGRAYDEQQPLKQIGTLLPFHTHVDAQTAASAVNNLIEDAARGQPVFYRF